ncbi:hypothetical protein MTR_6g445260 [Medicago truncatula]|uniref:Uncharacterized protein n=1 Tax=Medicago truncatula TaxID=3880 RepID=A0A072UAI6_MEDTR|nr:hypothetical protein MTR_6g445260 [Medicago truncatula]
MHVVTIQGIKPPTYLSINTLPGQQALNLLSKGSRASIPQRVEQRLQNQKSFSRQTKTTGKLTQLSTIFMFTPKANSNQKRVKKMQEHETGHAVR